MIYSCFDDKSGLYRYFEDDSQLPINGDLPIPDICPAVNNIGCPSIQSARPLPSSAKETGKGWFARGIVVNCSSSGSLGGTIDDAADWSTNQKGWIWLVAASAALGFLGHSRLALVPLVGAVGLAAYNSKK